MHRLKHSKSNRGGLRQRLTVVKHANIVGGASAVALGLLALAVVSPSVTEGVNAEELQVNLKVVDNLSVKLSSNAINMEVTPDIDGSFVSAKNDITLDVETTNPTGYKLYMSTKDGVSALTNTAGDTIESIASSNMMASSFPMNTWGYKMSIGGATRDTYDSIPSTLTTLDSERKGKETYSFNFGAKVNGAKSGTYTNTLVLSAVANPSELATLTDLTYMQDMRPDICKNTTIPADLKNPITKQLTDVRDGKKYWVSKLADGNCWMVQNLALDIDAEKGLSKNDTDITKDWNSSSTYPPTQTETEVPEVVDTDISKISTTTTRSWDLGEYVLVNPTDATACKNTGGIKPEGVTDDGYNSVWSGGNLDNCNRVEKYTGASNQDTHYLIGNYYQWNAATAGTGGTLQSTETELKNASGSICPKGWQLPTVDGGAEEARSATRFTQSYFDKYGNTTFSNLFNAYGYAFPNPTDDMNTPNIYGSSAQNGYIITTVPFFFSRAGAVSLSTGSMRTMGRNGFYWSSVASNDASKAYHLYFTSTPIYPSYSDYRGSGFPIRCLAR